VVRRRTEAYPGDPRDLLDALLAGTRTGESDDAMIVSVLRMAMFASHGVPGTALSWILLRLVAEPETAAAVRREATAELRPGAPESGAALELTTAVIQEVLRLHPPQWLLTRTALRATTLGGYPVRAGQEVLVCPYVLHRDGRFWSEPERFDPSRWLTGERPHARHAYLPFGAGPRICPGSALALRQLSVLTAVLARDFVLRLPALAEVEATCDGLLLPAGVRGGWERSRVGV
ncbi:MAG: cytochrome P450, partial [Actinocatenispora sp.]